MNTLKTAATRLFHLAPQGRFRWLKLAAYVVVFLLPFGMAMLALLVYLERRNRTLPAVRAVLPAPAAQVTPAVTAKSRRGVLPGLCDNCS